MLTLEAVQRHHHSAHRRLVDRILNEAGTDPEAVMRLFEAREADNDTVSFLREGLTLAKRAAKLSRSVPDGEGAAYRELAMNLVDHLLRKYLSERGSFIEYDRNSWLEPHDLWRTIPWGTGFRGNLTVDLYDLVYEHLPPESQTWWTDALGRIGGWVYKNPVVGSFVFNCAVDLCGLLWRVGHRLGREDWTRWALAAAAARIARDVDEGGWIHGENGGVSGVYQLVGADFLARFAWESRDEGLKEALSRVFGALVGFATPDLVFPGNFGTRSSHLRRLPPAVILVMAASGDPVAASLLRDHGEAAWSDDLALWEKALETAPRAPEHPPLQAFGGINSVVVREGPFQAHLCDYPKSIWARGFINLWHAGLGDMVFSTLHALPGEVEKSKLHLGDTSDWAGFPHVRVHGEGAVYNSQQRVEGLETEAGEGVTLRWQEPLLDPAGDAGGVLRSAYSFRGEVLEMTLVLEGLVGQTHLDFHLLKRPDSFFGIWLGEEVESVERGELPPTGGLFRDQSFLAGEARLLALQRDNTLLVFELLELPEGTAVTAGLEGASGLHTSNFGGFRVRLELPEGLREARFNLAFRAARRPA